MTAEVAVLNKFGVALAADSAVTVDHWHQNRIKTKVYNSANKLFTLSKFEPVGIMIYNAVTLGGIPWETLIKCYRAHLGRNKFDMLTEYSSNFFQWLEGNKLFSASQIDEIISHNLIRRFVDFQAKSKADLAKKLDEDLERLQKLESLQGFNDTSTIKVLYEKYRPTIETAARVVFKQTWLNGQKKKLKEYVSLLLSKKRPLHGNSGIVIAGFGDSEALPQLQEIVVDIVVDQKVRWWEKSHYVLNEHNPSEVVPLADADVIKTLIEGISPGFEKEAYMGALDLILSIPKSVIDPISQLTDAEKQQYIADARRSIPQHFNAFRNNMTKYRHDNYTNPVKQAISSLPISELGAVAETFLGAAQIQKRVNPDIETVGGPVDVAVISKGDGFVWLKRKHYFEEKYNPAFKLKYLER